MLYYNKMVSLPSNTLAGHRSSTQHQRKGKNQNSAGVAQPGYGDSLLSYYAKACAGSNPAPRVFLLY